MSRHWSFAKGFRLDLSHDWLEGEKEKGKNCDSEKVNKKEIEKKTLKENQSIWRKKLERKGTERKEEGKVQKMEKEEEEMKEIGDETGKKEAVAERRSPEKERKEVIEPLAEGEEGKTASFFDVYIIFSLSININICLLRGLHTWKRVESPRSHSLLFQPRPEDSHRRGKGFFC